MKLSVVVPAYNEERTIRNLLERVVTAPLPENVDLDIIVVDDCSKDRTGAIVQQFADTHPSLPIQYIRHAINQGKGAAIHTGIRQCTGDFLIVQDADLEYDPREYGYLLQPLLEDRADVVYGSRFMGGQPHRVLFFWHSIGNQFLTLLSNMFTDLNLTDMETCYKVFRTAIIKQLPLREQRFGFEPEVTAKLARVPGIRIYEVGISYYGRTYAEGKKINWKDGFRAIYCIVKYNLFVRLRPGQTSSVDQPFPYAVTSTADSIR
ncbi:glycosyltransferase family 2 protein [Spirosoma taeanense]|uniref:Glycosyltransferase family 2 protein n=1 Tax=Spirosoma taeanense TaxID=2735870 RepID=A0A6M5YDW1_9BACT|nr:glycosyltransferase family 2 protein [Spirosoma taeanense]QJW91142.1 glycosyltransferase family 2 protein [Spirosoma taeanense]